MERKKMLKILYGFIPHLVSNKIVLAVYDLLRKLQKFRKNDYAERIRENEAAFRGHMEMIQKNRGFIEDQNRYTDMRYGKVTMQYAGCEIFATYNAIYSILGKSIMSLSQMIAEYEKDGMVLSGRFGTSPKAIRNFLDKHGFHTEFATEESKFEELAKHCQSLILTMYNDRDDITKEVHTVNISIDNGFYFAHNVYCNGTVVGPCRTVKELMSQMNGGRVKAISLIGVSKND